MKLDRFTLVLSGRNDWVDTQQVDRTGGPDLSRDSSKATGRAGLIYDLGWGLSPYVSYATGFNPVIGTTATGQFFTPEESKQIEAGAKWEPAGFNGYVTGAWFDLRKTNALTVDPTNLFAQVQNGEVTSRGFELSMTTNLTPEFKMVGSVSSYDLFISQDVNAALLGKRPVAMPTRLASLWGDYTFRTGWLAGFGFGGGVRHVGDSFADQANTLAVPSRTLVRCGGSLRVPAVARGAERHQRGRQDLCVELRWNASAGRVVLLRRTAQGAAQPGVPLVAVRFSLLLPLRPPKPLGEGGRSGGEGSGVGVFPRTPMSANLLRRPPPPTPPHHAAKSRVGGGEPTPSPPSSAAPGVTHQRDETIDAVYELAVGHGDEQREHHAEMQRQQRAHRAVSRSNNSAMPVRLVRNSMRMKATSMPIRA